jgi:SSS family solute:Na+ symporter
LVQSKVQVNDTWLDYFIIAVYFVFVLGIGAIMRNRMQTSEDYFLSGRSLPSWVTGLAFLGALEIMGMGAGAAQYGIMQSHYYWIGAIPAMVFVALFMIPFYYASRVHSVPGFLKLRYNEATRGFNAILFAIFMILLSGINMYAMAIDFQLLLGWSLTASIFLSAGIRRPRGAVVLHLQRGAAILPDHPGSIAARHLRPDRRRWLVRPARLH